MKRIILFRFHKHPKICQSRLELLQKYNQDVGIYGLYGGKEKEFPKHEKYLRKYLKHLYCIRGKDKYWKWKNSDLAIRMWYQEIGKNLNFDMLHIVEWDLLLFDSIDSLYKDIPKNALGLTALQPLKNIEKTWYWTTCEPYKSEWKKLLSEVKNTFHYQQEPYSSLGPGICLPKSFLEKFSNTAIPELCHDELRLPLYGQIFGFPLYDSACRHPGPDEYEEKYFNCEGRVIKISTIHEELQKKSGRKIFHPYRKLLSTDIISSRNKAQ